MIIKNILVTYGDCQVGKYPGFAIFNFSISALVHYQPSSLLADLAALVVSPLSDWLNSLSARLIVYVYITTTAARDNP